MPANYTPFAGVNLPTPQKLTYEDFTSMGRALGGVETSISKYLENQDLKAATEAEEALKAASYKGDTQGIQDIMQFASSNIRDNKNKSLLLNQGRSGLEGIVVNEINLDLDEATRSGNIDLLNRALTKAQDAQGWISPEKQFELTQRLQTAMPGVEDTALGKQALSTYTSGIEAGIKRNLPIYTQVFNQNPEYANLFSLEQGTLMPKEVDEQAIVQQLGQQYPALTQTPEGVQQIQDAAQKEANKLRLQQSQLEQQFMQEASTIGASPINLTTGEQNLRDALIKKGRSSEQVNKVVGEYQKQVAMSNDLSSDAKAYEQQKHASIDQATATKAQITKDKYAALRKFTDAEINRYVGQKATTEADLWNTVNSLFTDPKQQNLARQALQGFVGKEHPILKRKVTAYDLITAINRTNQYQPGVFGTKDFKELITEDGAFTQTLSNVMTENEGLNNKRALLDQSEKEIDAYYKELQGIQARASEEKFRATREARVRIDGKPDISGSNKLLNMLGKAVTTALGISDAGAAQLAGVPGGTVNNSETETGRSYFQDNTTTVDPRNIVKGAEANNLAAVYAGKGSPEIKTKIDYSKGSGFQVRPNQEENIRKDLNRIGIDPNIKPNDLLNAAIENIQKKVSSNTPIYKADTKFLYDLIKAQNKNSGATTLDPVKLATLKALSQGKAVSLGKFNNAIAKVTPIQDVTPLSYVKDTYSKLDNSALRTTGTFENASYSVRDIAQAIELVESGSKKDLDKKLTGKPIHSFDPNSTAMSPMQVNVPTAMKPTGGKNIFIIAKEMGVPFNEKSEAEAARLLKINEVGRQMGIEYLSALFKHYDGDIQKVLEQYAGRSDNPEQWEKYLPKFKKYLNQIKGK